ncbi:unnamed protein product [Prunus armeniaca]|uniref:Uncharacterized protein n=1 Tax=Prunus armeniaca TaxID=36596 RepID=A0A6J5X729_PRUAR|nr:unnamed protein product [Prunus armeniaca]
MSNVCFIILPGLRRIHPRIQIFLVRTITMVRKEMFDIEHIGRFAEVKAACLALSLMRMLLAYHLQLISPTEATISSGIEFILLRQLIASLWIIFFMEKEDDKWKKSYSLRRSSSRCEEKSEIRIRNQEKVA